MDQVASLSTEFVSAVFAHVNGLLVKRDAYVLWQSLTVGTASVAVAVVLFKLLSFTSGPLRSLVHWTLTASSRKQFTEELRAARDRDIATLEKWALSDADGCPSPTRKERYDLLENSVVTLRDMMASKKLDPVFLLKASVLASVDAHRETNCLTCALPERAIADAKAARDKYNGVAGSGDGKQQQKYDPETDLLLGIPMSIKECIHLEGTHATAGCVAFAAGGPTKADGTLPAMLRRAGAVIFTKSNVPQTMLSYCCRNNIFGDTGNPHKVTMSPGGSSGGEAALVAARATPVGVGTDIGGSIRIPSHFCGIFGLKPSLWRAPAFGGATPVKGQEAVSSTAGPHGKSVSDLVEVFRALVAPAACTIDGTVNCIPFRNDMYDEYASKKKKLNIGYYVDDGWLVCSPATRRAVLETVDAMRKAGHTVTEFDPTVLVKATELFFRFIGADGCQTVASHMDGHEPPMKAVVVPWLAARVLPPWLLNGLVPFLLSFKSKVMGDALAQVKEMTVAEYYRCLAERNEARTAFARCIGEFDCVLCPGFVIPAPRIGTTADKSFGVSYTAAINVLDCSAVTIPVTKVDPARDAWTDETVPKNKSAQKASFDLMDRKMKSIYDADDMAGLPVGIQIVTPRSSEERALGCAQQISDVLKLECPKPPVVLKKN